MTRTSTHDRHGAPGDGLACHHCGALLTRRQTGTMDLSVTTRCPECCRDL